MSKDEEHGIFDILQIVISIVGNGRMLLQLEILIYQPIWNLTHSSPCKHCLEMWIAAALASDGRVVKKSS